MKVVVVGGCGFLGRHICDQLVDLNIEVLSVHRTPGHRLPSPLVQCVQLDYTDANEMRALMEGKDALIHLGSQTVPRTSANLGVAGILSEVEANALLFEAAADAHVQTVIFASSGGSVYGECPPGVPITELHATRPITPHGLLKVMTELALAHVARVSGQNAVSLRMGNVYGPGQVPKPGFGVVPTFLGNLQLGHISEIWGAEVVRDYIYVEDAACAFVAALTNPAELPGVLNIATSKGHAALEVYNILQGIIGKSIPIKVADKPDTDPGWNVLDIRRSRTALGEYSHTSLQQGLEKTVRWTQSIGKSMSPETR